MPSQPVCKNGPRHSRGIRAGGMKDSGLKTDVLTSVRTPV